MWPEIWLVPAVSSVNMDGFNVLDENALTDVLLFSQQVDPMLYSTETFTDNLLFIFCFFLDNFAKSALRWQKPNDPTLIGRLWECKKFLQVHYDFWQADCGNAKSFYKYIMISGTVIQICHTLLNKYYYMYHETQLFIYLSTLVRFNCMNTHCMSQSFRFSLNYLTNYANK